MSSPHGFFFDILSDWLSNEAVLLMDEDVRSKHVTLLCLAWRSADPGTLPDDDTSLRKFAGNPPLDDWRERIRPQLQKAWFVTDGFWAYPALRGQWQKKSSNSQKRQAAAYVRWGKPPQTASLDSSLLAPELPQRALPLPQPQDERPGFSLAAVIKDANEAFHEQATPVEKNTIWTIGVSLLIHDDFDSEKSRRFLGRMIQVYGEKTVAKAIAQLSLKPVPPAETKSYLTGILKGEERRTRGRGRVAL